MLDVGRTCPQFQEFGAIFAESKGLRGALCLYFAAVLGLCKEIVLFSRKRHIAQLPKLILPFETAFSDIQTRLHQLSARVRDEVTLAAGRLQKQDCDHNAGERKESTRFRSLMMRFKDQSLTEARRTNQQWSRHVRLDFLAGLTDYNHVTTWKQTRSKGTVEWIQHDRLYQRWKTSFSSEIFRLIGNLGSGKSVVVANVVGDLALQKRVNVSYFFCKFDDAKSLLARTVIGSLAKQMLLEVEFQASETVSSVADIDEIIKFLLDVLPNKSGQNHFICLDGIDECKANEMKLILSALERLAHSPRLSCKVFYSIRPDSRLATGRLLSPNISLLMSNVDKMDEIATYIRSTLEHQLESGALTLGDPGLIIRIAEQLSKKADGMYLWVYFQLQAICDQTTDEAILRTLNDLPEDMHETYARILLRLKHQSSTFKLFETIVSSERPLSTEELREVLSVEIGELSLTASRMENDISKFLDQSGGSLLVVDEEDSTVRFVHESVQQFLTKDIGDHLEISKYRIDVEKANLNLGLRCVTFLNMGIFDTQLTKVKDQSWKGILPDQIIKTSLTDKSAATKFALKLLKGGMDTDYDIASQFERIGAFRRPKAELSFAFLEYAKANVFTHTKRLLDCEPELDLLFVRTFNGHLPFVTTPWVNTASYQQVNGHGTTYDEEAISWAIDHEHFGLLYRALRSLRIMGADAGCTHDDKKFHVSEETLHNFFSLAFSRHSMEIVKFLLQTLHINMSRSTAVILLTFPAIAHGKGLIEEFLKQGPPLDPSKGLPRINRSELRGFGVSLQSKAMCLCWPRKAAAPTIQEVGVESGWDLFSLAAACDNIPMIDYIRKSGFLKGTRKGPLLQVLLRGVREASTRGHIAMVRHILSSYSARLSKGDELELSDEYGWTPLHYAAALPDPTVYEEIAATYRNHHSDFSSSNAFSSIEHGCKQILSAATSYIRPAWIFDTTEKEIDPDPAKNSGFLDPIGYARFRGAHMIDWNDYDVTEPLYRQFKHSPESVSQSSAESHVRSAEEKRQKFWLENQVPFELDAVAETGMPPSLKPSNNHQMQGWSPVYHDVMADFEAKPVITARSSTDISDSASQASRSVSMTSQESLTSLPVARVCISRRSSRSIEDVPTLDLANVNGESEIMSRRLSEEDKFIVIGEDKCEATLKDGVLKPTNGTNSFELSSKEEPTSKEHTLGFRENSLETALKEDRLEHLENGKRPVDTAPHTISPPRRRRKPKRKTSIASPRRNGPHRLAAITKELAKQQQIQAQVSQTQQATLEAQATLLQAIQAKLGRKPGWEDCGLALAILVIYAPWSLALILCIALMVQQIRQDRLGRRTHV